MAHLPHVSEDAHPHATQMHADSSESYGVGTVNHGGRGRESKTTPTWRGHGTADVMMR